MKYCIALAMFFSLSASAQKAPRIFNDDLKVLIGAQWIGTLTYLDYSSGKKNSIPANLTVIKKGKKEWNFLNKYPKEPQENNIDTVIISNKGRSLSNQKVVSRQQLNDGTIEVVTERRSNDDGVEKIFRYTYQLGNKKYSVKKEEKGLSDKNFIERNTYAYQRG